MPSCGHGGCTYSGSTGGANPTLINTPAREGAGIAQRNSASKIARIDFARIARKIRIKNLLFLFSAFHLSCQLEPAVRSRVQSMQLEPIPHREVARESVVVLQNPLNQIHLAIAPLLPPALSDAMLGAADSLP
jgi:hypothetical protein